MSAVNGRSLSYGGSSGHSTYNGGIPPYVGASAGFLGAYGPSCPAAAYGAGSSQRVESYTSAYQATARTQHQDMYNNPHHQGPYQAAPPSMGFQAPAVPLQSATGGPLRTGELGHAPSHWETCFASTYTPAAVHSGRGVTAPVSGTQYAGATPLDGYAGTASLGHMMAGAGPTRAGYGGQYGSFGSAATYGGHSAEMAAAMQQSQEAWSQINAQGVQVQAGMAHAAAPPLTHGTYTQAGMAGAYGHNNITAQHPNGRY